MKHHHFLLPWIVAGATLLVGCAVPASGARTPTPTATLDATTQAYLAMLRTYFVPWARDWIAERYPPFDCGYWFISLPATQQTQQLPACRPPLVTEIAAGKTLIAQLALARPPARGQAVHAALEQGMQAVKAYDAQRLHAIDAHRVSQYVSVIRYGGPEVGVLFCTPISAINVVLVSRREAPLPQPSEVCPD
jgi:hypothetical protein